VSGPDKTPPAHHVPGGGYRNVAVEFRPRSLGEVLRWRWQASRDGKPFPPQAPTPQVAPDLAYLQANRGAAQQPGVTWLGHATALVQLGGISLLTDPVFSERCSPLPFAGPKRHQPPGIALAELPHIELVLVSHNHYDHLDAASVQALARQPAGPPQFIVPLGLKAWFAKLGIVNCIELDWWQAHTLPAAKGDVTVELVPAQHWSARGLGDRMATLWGGFAVFAPDCHLFYAGDTAYSREFAHMRERYAPRQSPEHGGGFDLALLPIGAYEPRWFMGSQHINVEEALRIHRDLGAKRSLGLHWGTFALADEAVDEPPRELARQRPASGLSEDEFFVTAIGETRRLPAREHLHDG